jgi:ATPase subunit of ABC transporter with duplicated ATPase domains
LSNWGGKDGAVVVISHDRSFCESVGFTHVGTVMDGGLIIEERGLEEKDWARYDIASTSGGAESICDGSTSVVVELSQEEKAELESKRKLAFNAPKRIRKIEQLIEKAEQKISEYAEEMMKYGSDVEALMQLTEKKTKEEESIANLMEEWGSLEEVVAEMSGQL